MKFTQFIAASTVAVLMSTASFAQDTPDASTVVVTVNGDAITIGHVIAMVDRLPERFKQAPDADLFKAVVDQLIQQSILAKDVDTDRKSIQLALENEKRAIAATETLNKVEAAATTEDMIEKAYAEQYTSAPASYEYHALHILVDTEEEAKGLVTSLEDGADFGELAKEKSTGPTGKTGGDLGWMGKGRTVPEFENAMIALDAGTISAPVQTQFGWHVIKLVEKREVPKPALVEVRVELIENLKNKAVGTHLEKAELTADIKRTELDIEPSIIRNSDMLDN